MTAAGAERSREKGTFFLVLPNQSLKRKFWDWRRPGSFLQPSLFFSNWGFYTRRVKREAAF